MKNNKIKQKRLFLIILAILVLIILALFFLRSCSATTENAATGKAVEFSTTSAQCKESDNGNDPGNAGVIAWRTKASRSGSAVWTKWYQSNDLWDNRKGKIKEYYCGADGKPQTEYFTCASGYDKTALNYLEKVNHKLVPVDAYYCKPTCGNEIVEAGEECDDGNQKLGDGCNSACVFDTCGNGFVEEGEDCGTISEECTFVTLPEIKPVGTKSTDSLCAERIYAFQAIPPGSLANTEIKDDECISVYEGIPIIKQKGTNIYRYVQNIQNGLPTYSSDWSLICLDGKDADTLQEFKKCIDNPKNIDLSKSIFYNGGNCNTFIRKMGYPFPLEKDNANLFIPSEADHTFGLWLVIPPELKEQVKSIRQEVDISLIESFSAEKINYNQKLVFNDLKDRTLNPITIKYPYPGKYKLIFNFYATSLDGTLFAKETRYGGITIFPKQPSPKLFEVGTDKEINANEITDSHKINLVFLLGSGWTDKNKEETLSEFKTAINQALYGKISFFSMEPFKSNPQNFNVWYSSEIFDTFASPMATEEEFKQGGMGSLGEYQKFRLGLNIPNLMVIRLDKQKSNSVGIHGSLCGTLDAIQLVIYGNTTSCDNTGFSLTDCYEKIHIGGTFLHEFGHKFSYLSEEYPAKQLLGNEEEYFQKNLAIHFNDQIARKTSFHTDLINSEIDCTEIPLSTSLKEYSCKPSLNAIKFCMENSPWKDLLGNGCGQEGIIDCPVTNPNHKLEISCAYTNVGFPLASLYGDVTKSTGISLMEHVKTILNIDAIPNFGFNYDTTYEPKDRLFGQANERELCRSLKMFTDSANGICQELCLEGCSDNQRCIKGQCVIPIGEDLIFDWAAIQE